MPGESAPAVPGGSATFGARVYLNRRGREIANRYARKVILNNPEVVNDATDPSLGDIMAVMDADAKDPTREAAMDHPTLSDLWAELTAEEALMWYLFQHCGLSHREIFLAKTGKGHSPNIGDAELRNVHVRLQSAALALGHDPDTIRDPRAE